MVSNEELSTFYEKNEENGTGVCKICNRSITFTNNNLKSHLRMNHPEVFDNFVLRDSLADSEGEANLVEEEPVLSDNGSDSIKILITSNSDIWDIFQEIPSTKIALCFICNKCISFKSTVSYLYEHLKINHTEVYDLITKEPITHVEIVNNTGLEESHSNNGNGGNIWDFFEPDHLNKIAKCNECQRIMSFKSSIGYLKRHLKTTHWTAYNNFISLCTSEISSKEDSSDAETLMQVRQSSNFDSESLSSSKKRNDSQEQILPQKRKKYTRKLISKVWDYFEKNPLNQTAKCNSCQKVVSYKSSITNIKKHLRVKHIEVFQEMLSHGRFNNSQTFLNKSIEEYSHQDLVSKLHSPSENESDVWSLEEEMTSPKQKKKRHQMKELNRSPSPLQNENTFNSATLQWKENVWNYFKPNNKTKIARCNICLNNLSYKTNFSNLKHHLQAKHKQAYITCTSKPNSQSKDFHTIFISAGEDKNDDGVNNNTELFSNSYNRDGQNVSGKPFQTLQRQKGTVLTPEGKKNVDMLLLKIITEDFQPLNIVEDAGFKKLVTELNPHYPLPDYKALFTILTDQYTEKVAKYQKLVQDSLSVSLTLEFWTSRDLQNFLAVTGHFIDKDSFQFHSVFLQCVTIEGEPTGENVAQELRDIINSWNISNIVNLIVSENVSNIKVASTILEIPHFECYLSTFNFIMQQALKEPSITSIVNKVELVAVYFKKNHEAKQKLFGYQATHLETNQTKNFILSIKTHWVSVYQMLKRFCDLQEALSAINWDIVENVPPLTSDEWQCINQLVAVLKPFEEAITILSDEDYLIASKAVVLTAGLNNVCTESLQNKTSEPVKCLILKLQEGFSTHFGNIEKFKEISICTLLDPRFKQHAFEDQEAMLNAKQYILAKYKEIMRKGNDNVDTNSISKENSESQSSVWGRFYTKVASTNHFNIKEQKSVSELNMYFSEDVIPRSESPLTWWKERKMLYPVLSTIFVTCFNIVVTSRRERFSKSSYVLTDRRNHLPDTEIDKIMFLNVNK